MDWLKPPIESVPIDMEHRYANAFNHEATNANYQEDLLKRLGGIRGTIATAPTRPFKCPGPAAPALWGTAYDACLGHLKDALRIVQQRCKAVAATATGVLVEWEALLYGLFKYHAKHVALTHEVAWEGPTPRVSIAALDIVGTVFEDALVFHGVTSTANGSQPQPLPSQTRFATGTPPPNVRAMATYEGV